MTSYFQGSLFDGDAGPEVAELGDTVRRTELSRGAWVDVRPGWLTGADALFLRLQADVPWRAEQREMYDRVVDVPRLVCFYDHDTPLPDPALDDARDALSSCYATELGEPFMTAGLCYYRDGRDSVAWHGDRIGRGRLENTMVAIVSLGEHRRLSLRPRGGGEQRGFTLGHGDLVVMGGTCQRTWEHAVLKTAKPVGPRISVQFRPSGVR
ncbi:alpha-ketoglutarate-dependent dioxygenase AlkB [Aeromicrobium sp.]|uniref:alpha-ketoglutarate-dependent dioxygenase AlkB n=1 Tax=Aeromicrobium sp. TaxID=1871063 RepID=UPI003D6C4564